jgi:GNAT superfamily N-acetyltransferase
MIFREARTKDISQLHSIRISVHENQLPDHGLISANDYEEFINHRGKGWVCEIDDKIIGFAIVDLKENNLWALFIQPDYERKGAGKKLHDVMLDWYFHQTNKTIWLGTAPNTRAEIFYRKAEWKETGIRPNGEIKFEMTAAKWKSKNSV